MSTVMSNANTTPQPHSTPERAPGAPLYVGRTLTGDFVDVSQFLPYETMVYNGEMVNQPVPLSNDNEEEDGYETEPYLAPRDRQKPDRFKPDWIKTKKSKKAIKTKKSKKAGNACESQKKKQLGDNSLLRTTPKLRIMPSRAKKY